MNNRDVIVACDFASAEETLRFLERFGTERPFLKIGMELYYAEGTQIVRTLKDRGHGVFLDLKLHDIPFQIQGAAYSAALTGADIMSIHGLGGAAMIEQGRSGAERAAAESGRERARLVAITVLTSMDQEALASIGVTDPVADEVNRLAKLAVGAGADGIVCSPEEAQAMRALLGPDAWIVCPGIRPQGADVGDQKRISTPAAAIAAGATKLVIGRPITKAQNPVAAFDAIVDELVGL